MSAAFEREVVCSSVVACPTSPVLHLKCPAVIISVWLCCNLMRLCHVLMSAMRRVGPQLLHPFVSFEAVDMSV